MVPQRSDVTNLVLYLLGDTQSATGTLYTAAFQAPLLNAAYQEVFGKLSNLDSSLTRRDAYFLLPAYTGVLSPSVAGIVNFDRIVEIHERGSANAYAISAVTPNSAAGTCAVTCAALPSSVQTGAQVEVYGVGGVSADVNDQWYITVNSTTSIVLNGCAAGGTYTSGGNVVYSTETWSDPLAPYDNTDDFPSQPGSALGMYTYQRGVLRFPAASGARELKIQYEMSSSLPVSTQSTTDSMNLDGILNFLAHRTAQLCAASKGNPREAKLTQQADYHLALYLQSEAREQQNSESVVPALFRGKRNVRIGVW